jgi:hypothetical protein
MNFFNRKLASMVIVASLLAGAIDSAAGGAGAGRVITVDTHGNTKAFLAELAPMIELLAEISPTAIVEVFEATVAGEETGTIYVMIRYPDLLHLAEAAQLADRSKEWASSLRKQEITGRTLKSMQILEDRMPK